MGKLFLDMDLLYEKKPNLKSMSFIIEALNLPALLRLEVSVSACVVQLCSWASNGDVNCLFALVLYAGFAVLLPILDMVLLFTAALLDLFGSAPAAERWLSAMLAWSRK